MLRLLVVLSFSLALFADCRVPDIAPDALARLSPEQLIAAGHYLRAERILDPIAKQRPGDARVAWLLSRARAPLGDLESALKLAEIALAADGSNPAYHVQVAAVAGQLAEKAGLLKRLTYAHRARQELDAAIALDANNTDARWGLMMYYFVAPPLIGGDKSKAQELGEELAASVPDLGRYYQGRLAAESKDLDKAESYFKQAALENPLSFDTVSALANFYIEKKPDQSRAERWACQAVHAEPTRGDAWALLAKVHTMCGCWTEAIDFARQSEAIDPDDLSPWFTIASVAVARGEQLEMAIEFLRKYLSKPTEGGQPNEALARLELGRALAKSGKNLEAATELKAAIELDSTLEEARAQLKRLRQTAGAVEPEK